MTENNSEKLESFFGSLSNIRASSKAGFIASVNRNCFIGAVNFLITLILKHNPRARFVFIGNQENWSEYLPVVNAQQILADSWQAPLINAWQRLGFSGHYIPGTQTYLASSGTGYTGYDLTQLNVWNKDNVHPHSDSAGITLPLIAGVLAEQIKQVR